MVIISNVIKPIVIGSFRSLISWHGNVVYSAKLGVDLRLNENVAVVAVRPYIHFLVQKKVDGFDSFAIIEDIKAKYPFRAAYQNACATALYRGELNSVSSH